MRNARPDVLWRTASRWVALLGVMLLAAQVLPPLLAVEPKPATVRLVVDYGDGSEVHFTAIKWRDGMTVLDALGAAKMHPRGVSFDQRGSGRSALITQIGNLSNEGGGATSKNWLYYVNGKAAEVSAGERQLHPGDVILWKFQVYDYNS